jgi:hypothetical protein
MIRRVVLRSAVCAAALAALALPARAGGFSRANYGQRLDEVRPVRMRLEAGAADEKTLGFSLASAQTVRVRGGTARSHEPLQGACGTIARTDAGTAVAASSGAQSGTVSMSWAAHERRNGKAAFGEYDCDYTGSLDPGVYAVKLTARFRHGEGPAVAAGDGSAPGELGDLSVTGPANDLRLSFVNNDAAAADVSASGLGGGGAYIVKVYRYAYRLSGQGKDSRDHGQKRAVLKAKSGDPRLASVPLEPGAAYTVIVRGGGGERTTAVLTVTAAEASTDAVATSTAAAPGAAPGGDDNGQ